jgi:hypothetical protein
MKNVKGITLALALALIMALTALLAACASPIELSDGERYFEGDIDFAYAESCTVSIILSADGKSFRRVNVTMKNFEFKEKFVDGSYRADIHEKTGTKSVSLQGGTIDAEGYLEMRGTEVTLRFNIAPDSVTGEMDYSYYKKSDDISEPTIDIFLGTYPFTMEDRTDSVTKE